MPLGFLVSDTWFTRFTAVSKDQQTHLNATGIVC
jgi:hypothetical protein